jgi:hypothetical protein
VLGKPVWSTSDKRSKDAGELLSGSEVIP